MNPYAVQSLTKKAKRGADLETEGNEEDALDESEDEEDKDITKDSMIKVKKQTGGKEAAGKAGKSKAKAEPKKTNRGKGKAR